MRRSRNERWRGRISCRAPTVRRFPASIDTYTINGATCSRTGIGGSLLLRSDPKGYEASFDVRTSCGGGSPVTSNLGEIGTWSLSGSVLTLTRSGGSTMTTGTATVNATEVTLPVQATALGGPTLQATLVYKR